MLRSEFVERTGFEPMGREYEEIEAEYMASDEDKDTFCKRWKKQGGIERLIRIRARRIEELESNVTTILNEQEKKVRRLESEIMALREANESLRNMAEDWMRKASDQNERAERAESELNRIKGMIRSLVKMSELEEQ